MDIAWAFSLYTVQYIDGVLYGATVLGGNILKVDRDGIAKIVWMNDYSDQHKGGVLLYSVRYDNKLIFFPYMSEQIVVYDMYTNEIEKILFRCKGKNEKIFAHVYNNSIFMFGLTTGRVWKLQGSKIEIINEEYKFCGELLKYRRTFENKEVAFCDTNDPSLRIYDCQYNTWRKITFSSEIEDGFVWDNDIWMIENGNLHCFSEENKDEVIISGSDDDFESFIIQANADKLLFFESKGIIREIDMKSHSVKNIRENDFSKNLIQWGVELGNGNALLIDIDKLDWMLRGNDKYKILYVKTMTFDEVDMFNMNSLTSEMIKDTYFRVVWNLSPDLTKTENKDESLSFMIDSLRMGVF